MSNINIRSNSRCLRGGNFIHTSHNDYHLSQLVAVVVWVTAGIVVLNGSPSRSVLTPIQAWTPQVGLPSQLLQHRHRLYSSTSSSSSNSGPSPLAPQVVTKPKGSAAVPYSKQKILTMGNGGYLGGILFGYLQRASTIYTTGIGGIGGGIRSIGATADTSIRLNRILNKHFVLAQADESYIKLTDLTSIDAIQQRMMGYDAIVLGTNLYLERRKVAANTYEVTPNDQAWEIYWDEPRGSYTDFQQSTEAIQMKETILGNFVAATQLARLKHIFLVVTSATTTIENDFNDKMLRRVQASGIPFTCIQIRSKLIDRSSQGYTYQEGIIDPDIIIESVTDIAMTTTMDNQNSSMDDNNAGIHREDVAAICVQAIQSCDWNQPQRYLTVQHSRTTTSTTPTITTPPPPTSSLGIPKRMDQLWCINAHSLEDQLNRIP